MICEKQPTKLEKKSKKLLDAQDFFYQEVNTS